MEEVLFLAIAFGTCVLLLCGLIQSAETVRNKHTRSYGLADLTTLGAATLSLTGLAIIAYTWKFYPTPFVLIILSLSPILVTLGTTRPFLLCVLFVSITYFRIHEIFPFFLDFNIPQFLAMLSLLALAWNLIPPSSLEPYLTLELKLFLVFFVIVTIGIFFAYYPDIGWELWLEKYWKIGIMTIAIAWLAKKPQDFSLAARAFMIGGLLVAVIAISNKLSGIDLVEGTRVTIGTGTLGDPNDLALVLLFPMGFSMAALVYREKAFDTVLALATTSAAIWAIIATQSRGGMLGVLAVLTVIGLQWTKSSIRLLFLILPVSAGLFFAAGIGARFATGDETVSTLGLDASADGRLNAWTAAISMAFDRPLMGIGLGNFAPEYGIATHSTWFQVLAETGFPGLIVYAALVIVCWRRITTSIKKLNDLGATASTNAIALGLQAGLLGFCVSGSFLSQPFNFPIYIYVALIAAVGHYATILSCVRESGKRTTHRIAAL